MCIINTRKKSVPFEECELHVDKLGLGLHIPVLSGNSLSVPAMGHMMKPSESWWWWCSLCLPEASWPMLSRRNVQRDPMSNSWKGRSHFPRWGDTMWIPRGGSLLYYLSTLTFNSLWTRSCLLESCTFTPIIYKAARHWMVCLGLGCRLSGSTWGTF